MADATTQPLAVTEQPAPNPQPGQQQIQVNIDYLKTTRAGGSNVNLPT